LLFNTNSAIFQLHNGENKLIFNEIQFVLGQHAKLNLITACSLKQQPADRHVSPLEHNIQIPSSTAEEIPHSSTNDSLAEIQGKFFTPSLVSSGYGSQAVSMILKIIRTDTIWFRLYHRLQFFSLDIRKTTFIKILQNI
jgi:hypothetical protein